MEKVSIKTLIQRDDCIHYYHVLVLISALSSPPAGERFYLLLDIAHTSMV
jgi:hypothetical protein